ncbi:protein of unknown function [Lutibacter oricola]|uniref:DUF4252 domain-containing protein n=1 Tax=Lutibacter oricola TaxID=762486 RepID=A0A1H2XCX2_9FLAO|nr:DUF4252 domain-containing protein [Lutibacter oricola]SDW90578.1 protein of unknown function [Lutibacter oricola]
MKNILKNIGLIFISVLLLTACESTPSLQKYIVDGKENSDFIAIDLPSNILQLKETGISEDAKKTLETIKKVNVLALQLNDTNEELYKTEKLKVKEILKNPKYKQLARFNMGKSAVNVSYLGTEDAVDEVVVFGSDNKKGFALVRVLGNNMNPSQIMEMAQHLKLNGGSQQMSQLEGIFKSISK